MGVGETLEFISELMGTGHTHKKKKKTLQTVELKVRMDCEGCELKVKKALSSLSGRKTLLKTFPLLNWFHYKLCCLNLLNFMQEYILLR